MKRNLTIPLMVVGTCFLISSCACFHRHNDRPSLTPDTCGWPVIEADVAIDRATLSQGDLAAYRSLPVAWRRYIETAVVRRDVLNDRIKRYNAARQTGCDQR